MVSYREDGAATSLKLKLISYIREIVSQKGLTQTEAAKMLDISRSRFCRMLGGQTKDVSEGRLIQCIIDLGNDINITIMPVKDRSGKVQIIENGATSTIENQEVPAEQ